MGRRRKAWQQLDLLALDPARLAASFDGELEREANARTEELILSVLIRDEQEGLKARKRLYRRAVMDRRILLWIVLKQREEINRLAAPPALPAEERSTPAGMPCG